MTRPESRPPPRLSESAGEVGELLRRALAEQATVAKPPPFTELQQKRLARGRSQAAALLAAASVALLICWRALGPNEPPLIVSAEPVMAVTAETREASSPAIASPPEPTPAPPPVSNAPLVRHDAEPKPRVPALAPPAASAGHPRAAEVAPGPPAALNGGARPCAELARAGAVEDAMRCYEALAAGSGVSAELALFEQARLAGKALRQPARALSLLDQYRGRFANGSLRAEAMLASIEWSLAAGDKARARAEVAEALASGLLRERRAELERLKASLDAEPGDHRAGATRE